MLNQIVSIHKSDPRLYDFSNISSRVFLGDTINKLLKPYGKSPCILSGLKVSNLIYNDNDTIELSVSPGNVIIDTTFITYNLENSLSIDVKEFDDKNGFLLVVLMFGFVGIMKKNYSKLITVYVNNDGTVPNRVWYKEQGNIILAKIIFNKENKTARSKAFDIVHPHKITVENEQYELRPVDLMTKRTVEMLNSYYDINDTKFF